MSSALAVCSAPAFSQDLRQCKGDFPHPVSDAPFKFLTTTRYDKSTDHAIGYTCVENQVKGYFRFRWHVPGQYADFSDLGANELPRPLAISDIVRPLVGCLSYGNLSSADKSTFHGDDADAKRIELENQQGCPKTLAASGSVMRPSTSGGDTDTKPPIIPKQVHYEYTAAFFFNDPEKERDVTRIRFKIAFEQQGGEAAQVSLGYSVISPPGSPAVGERSIRLRPAMGTDTPSVHLREAFTKTFGAGEFKLEKTEETVSLRYPAGKRFGSARLTVNSPTRALSAFWVPVLY
jgi:hypothetical protein